MINHGQNLSEFQLKSGETAIIRVAQLSDAEAINTMNIDHATEDGPVSESELSKVEDVTKWLAETLDKMQKGEYILCYAFLGNQIVGECSIERRIGKSYHLGDLGISTIKSYRQQGVATALLDAIEPLAKQCGIEKIVLDVKANNTSAINLYKKQGYIQHGLLLGGYKMDSQYIDQTLMYKEL